MTDSPFFEQLEGRARAVNSLLCVGLDPHPEFLSERSAAAAYAFCQRLIDATHDLACAFKPNSAFFEALGAEATPSCAPSSPTSISARRASP